MRLVGVDTPEAGQCFAREATAQTRALAVRRRVTLVGDRRQPTRDRFRRLLAYVTLPGRRDLGLALLQGGFAEVPEEQDGRFERFARYAVAQRDARDAHRGQWGRCIPLADLAIAATDAPDPATVGQQLTYTIVMTNLGPRPAEVPHLSLTFAQEPGQQVSATAPPGWSCDAGETSLLYECGSPDFSVLEANAIITFQFTFLPSQPGVLNARAFATSPIEDPNEANNLVDVSTTVMPGVPPPPPHAPPPPPGRWSGSATPAPAWMR